jgi:hypothetical protein
VATQASEEQTVESVKQRRLHLVYADGLETIAVATLLFDLIHCLISLRDQVLRVHISRNYFEPSRS